MHLHNLKADKEPFLIKSFKNESFTSAQNRTSGGSISVTGVEASEARVEVYIYPNNNKNDLSKEEIEQRLNEKYDLDISVVNNKLVAAARNQRKNNQLEKSIEHFF